MDVILTVTLVATLFLVMGLSEPLAGRLRIPYSVVLAVVGIVIGIAAVFFLQTPLTDALNPVAQVIVNLPITSQVFLYVFLPTLLFQVSLGLNLRRMMDDWVPILTMAVVAVVVATLAVGYALAPISGLPLAACLLIGAIVSTTDPSAVVGIFRNIAAPQRLTRIVEGESLLNDAAAIALFGLFISFVMRGVPDPDIGAALLQFPWLIAGGLGAGWLMGRVAVSVMSLVGRYLLAQVSISVALPYLTYVLGERVLGVSGVVAVVAAGMTLNLVGPARLLPAAWNYLREVWDLLAHWAGALIFVLAALLIPRLMGDVRLADLGLLLVVILAAVGARVFMLFGVLPLLSFARLSPQVQRPYRLAILWGGLRGAVTLALALAVTENLRVPAEVQRLVGILATGLTLFTLIAQGTTLRWVISRLGLDRLSPLDAALSHQVIAVALQNVREDVAESARDHALSRETVRSEAKRFGERLDEAVRLAEAGTEILDRDRITLGLIALAGRERDLVLEAFLQQLVSQRLVERMLSDVDRLIEATRLEGRSGYRRAGRRALGYGPGYRAAVALHNRLRIAAPLARLTAERFEILLNQRMILRDLHAYIDTKIRRIHGRRVSDLLHELLARREEGTESALAGLRLQYPGYAEELERQYLRRMALRLEEREYDVLRADGLIGPELHTTLRQQLARARGEVEPRPRLDLAVRKTELVRQFPLFADMDEAARKRLARALTTVYAEPGEVIVRRGDTPRSVFFIASGAVEVDTAGQKIRLGRGEMFGQLAMLGRQRRKGQVTVISHSTLLSLDETRFRRLLERQPSLRQAVRDSAARRGVRLVEGSLTGDLQPAPVAEAAASAPADPSLPRAEVRPAADERGPVPQRGIIEPRPGGAAETDAAAGAQAPARPGVEAAASEGAEQAAPRQGKDASAPVFPASADRDG
ncbi:cation:proton antiporter [Plastorhodobacter daqingensis]|uniref:Cation:proton antiporter n=1 Tax=Plastorhodobacter daqingensis TaxID=1387281 RepID=A0ABW2UFC1_9RHOB